MTVLTLLTVSALYCGHESVEASVGAGVNYAACISYTLLIKL